MKKDPKKEPGKKKDHEPTNAEISMKALQGTGAYEDEYGDNESIYSDDAKTDSTEKRR